MARRAPGRRSERGRRGARERCVGAAARLSGSRAPVDARDLKVAVRVAAYLAVLLGYLFYCYNFVVIDYVRPYLISRLGFSVGQTATISVAQNIGITLGAICWAGFIARAGRRRAVGAIAAAIGLLALAQAASSDFTAWVGARGLIAAALGGYYVVATGLVVALFPPRLRGKLIALNSAMYPGSNILVGLLGGALGDDNWHLLLWLGAAPLPLSLLLLAVVPDDRRYRAYDEGGAAGPAGSWREMIGPRWRRLTAGCVLLSGIDFNAYQLFFSFVTLYLRDVRGASAAGMGSTVALISTGSLVGGFVWAALSDRYGRRLPLVGYLIAAAAILAFLYARLAPGPLGAAGFVFGFGLSCTSAWGVWFAELFPPRLRPHGAALFHAGHVLAFGAPLFAAGAVGRFGLTSAMAVAAAVYCVGAAVWAALPETLGRPPAA